MATKFAPYPYRIGSQSIVKACDETLERLEADVRREIIDRVIVVAFKFTYRFEEKKNLAGFGAQLCGVCVFRGRQG